MNAYSELFADAWRDYWQMPTTFRVLIGLILLAGFARAMASITAGESEKP